MGADIGGRNALSGPTSQVRREGIVIRSITELDACCWGRPKHCRDNARRRVIKHQLKASVRTRGQHMRRLILVEGRKVEEQAQVLITRATEISRRR